jgi:hypothetical protein
MADVQFDTFDLAYFAGFFDGEGCVAAYRKKYVVSLTNTDVRPLKQVQALWGGAISTQVDRPGAVRDIWRWQIYGQKSRPFLEAIRPYVRLKGEQIDAYLAILTVLPNGRGQRYAPGAAALIASGSAQLRLMKRGG